MQKLWQRKMLIGYVPDARHDAERKAIAYAGQQRTLQEHTYAHRVQELVEIVRSYCPQN